MRRKLILLMLLCLALNLPMNGQQATCPDAPWITAPGLTLRICGNLPGPTVKLGLDAGAGDAAKRTIVYARVSGSGQDKQTVDFQVPSVTAGWYSLYATVDGKDSLLGPLQVMEPVKVDAIYPLTNYPTEKGRTYDFEIVGSNFSPNAEDNLIEVVGEQYIPPRPCSPTSNTTNSANTSASNPATTQISNTEIDQPPCLKSSHTQLEIQGFHPKHFFGPTQFVVHVGTRVSEPRAVSFSYASQQLVAAAAAVVFLGLAFLFLGLVRKGVGVYNINGQKFGLLTALFLDRQTNSYSLSKFQVIAWTAVVVYSYVYLFLCRTLVQGNFIDFPGVAQNIPQLFFVSAGTTVAAAAITANYGSKGAGPAKPTPADFISTGGFVAGDRFQFFVWTIVGCLGYVYLVVRSDPFRLTELPSLPDNFLYLMGVSSAGYLGGKLVRKPGPVIKTLSVGTVIQRVEAQPNAAAKPASMTIELNGENLDPRASIKVDDVTLRADLFSILPTQGQQPDAQSQFCTELTITLREADKYIQGSHTLTLINADAQAASASFPADPLTIDSVPDQVPGNIAVDIVAKGKNFADGMTATWTNAAGVMGVAEIRSRKDTSELTVRFTPGLQAGTGKLTLTSAIGLKASKDVIVRNP